MVRRTRANWRLPGIRPGLTQSSGSERSARLIELLAREQADTGLRSVPRKLEIGLILRAMLKDVDLSADNYRCIGLWKMG